jgi:hypothetical protein
LHLTLSYLTDAAQQPTTAPQPAAFWRQSLGIGQVGQSAERQQQAERALLEALAATRYSRRASAARIATEALAA